MSSKQLFNKALREAVKLGLVVKYKTRTGVVRYRAA